MAVRSISARPMLSYGQTSETRSATPSRSGYEAKPQTAEELLPDQTGTQPTPNRAGSFTTRWQQLCYVTRLRARDRDGTTFVPCPTNAVR